MNAENFTKDERQTIEKDIGLVLRTVYLDEKGRQDRWSILEKVKKYEKE